MPTLHGVRAIHVGLGIAVMLCVLTAGAQNAPAGVTLSVVDENGAAVSGAVVVIEQPGSAPARMATDFRGHLSFELKSAASYSLHVEKPGFYQSEMNGLDTRQPDVHLVLTHEQMVVEQVNVSASSPGIDPGQVSDKMTMEMPEMRAMGRPEVLLVRMARGARCGTTRLSKAVLISRFSATASTIRSHSASLARSSSKVPGVIRRPSGASKKAAGFDLASASSAMKASARSAV